MALKNWPDLTKQGWQLAVMRHYGGEGFSLVLDRINIQGGPGQVSEIEKFGFVWNRADSRWETEKLRFRVSDVEAWFPDFTPDQMRPMLPPVFNEEPGAGLHAVNPGAYPTDDDLYETDGASQILPVFLPQEEFEKTVEARTFAVGENDTLDGLMARLESVDLFLSDRRRVAASALHSVREVGASLHVIDRVGEFRFNPPLRFHPEGQLPGKQYADYEALHFGYFLAESSSPPLEFVVKWLGDAPRLSMAGDLALVWDWKTGEEIEDFKGVAFSRDKKAFAWTECDASGERTVRWLKAKLYLDAVTESKGRAWVQGRPSYELVGAALLGAGWKGEQAKTWESPAGAERFMVYFLENGQGNGHFMLYRWDENAFVPIPGVRDIPFTGGSNPAEIASRILSICDGGQVQPEDRDAPGEKEAPVEEPATGDKQAQRDSSKKIVDAGEKIGGARKDFFRKSMTVEDLEGMSSQEKMTLVVLANIWPLNLRAMKEAGVAPGVAAYLRTFRRAIRKPDSEIEVAHYVRVFNCFQKHMAEVKTPEDLTAAFKAVDEEEPHYYHFVGFKGQQLMIEGIFGRPDGYRGRYVRMDAEPARAWSKLLPKRFTGGNPPEGAIVYPDRPHLDHLGFVGPSGEEDRALEFRSGRDVTAEDLIHTFGFRGIEFGNWLPQDERQRVLNYAYDSCLMLARAMNVPPKIMSLNGVLALAFGSRGNGQAVAHFEPGRWVVNMTRIRGAGAYAHEFFHALDLWLGVALGCDTYLSAKYANGAKGYKMKGELPEGRKGVATGILLVMGAIQTTPLSLKESLLRLEASYQRGLDWSKSWVRRPLRDALEEAMMDSERSCLEADGRLDALYDNAIMESERPLGFDPEKAAEVIYGHLRERYDIRLKKKAKDKVLSNLRTVSATASVIAQLKMPEDSPEHQATLARCFIDSSYLEAARQLDKKRKGRFLPPTELGARAFEAYVFDALKAEGLQDDYLVSGVEENRFADESRYLANPYPCKEERERINQAFRTFSLAVKAFIAPEDSFRVPLLTYETRRAASMKL